MDAAKEQEHKISQLDRSIESVRSMSAPDTSMVRTEVNRQEEKIYDNFNQMMGRLNQIE